MENLGINLRALRGKRTLEQVAKGSGLSISSICKFENGKLSISKKSAEKLSKFYGVDIPVSVVGYVQLDKNVAITQRIKFHIEANRLLHEENTQLKQRFKEVENKLSVTMSYCKNLEKMLADLYAEIDFINN